MISARHAEGRGTSPPVWLAYRMMKSHLLRFLPAVYTPAACVQGMTQIGRHIVIQDTVYTTVYRAHCKNFPRERARGTTRAHRGDKTVSQRGAGDKNFLVSGAVGGRDGREPIPIAESSLRNRSLSNFREAQIGRCVAQFRSGSYHLPSMTTDQRENKDAEGPRMARQRAVKKVKKIKLGQMRTG